MIWRWGKWALLVLALLAMPFCWSFGRDGWALLSTDADGRQDVHFHLLFQLLDADTYGTEMAQRSRRAMHLTVVQPLPCEVFPKSSIRQNPELPGTPDPASGDERFYPQLYIDQAGDDVIRFRAAVDRFPTLEAAALRACIESTPFGYYCARYRNDALNLAIGDIDERRVESGMRRRVSPARRYSFNNYCTPLPMPVD